jgi:hypothetical protein
LLIFLSIVLLHYWLLVTNCHHGCDRMVVVFTTTYAISAYHHWIVTSNPFHGEMYSIPHYVIKFVSFSQYSSFLRQ